MTWSEFIDYHKRLAEEGRIDAEDLKIAMLLGMSSLIEWKNVDIDEYKKLKNK